MRSLAVWLFSVASALASQHSGQVLFSALPVPGATITATRGDTKLSTVTDERGIYTFADLSDGAWTFRVEMTGFVPVNREVTVSGNTPLEQWELKLLPLDQMQTVNAVTQHLTPTVPQPTIAPTAPQLKEAKSEDENTADGLLINGSTNNGASSPFAQFPAFGNARSGKHGLYNGGIGFIGDTSVLDARAFSLTGQETPKPSYSRLTGIATLGGPMKIPHLLTNGPVFFIAYQWTRDRDANTTPALVPTLAQRNGAGLPLSQLSPQALALLRLYPLPNFSGSSRYNYQIPLVDTTHQDAMQARLNKALGQRNQLYGRLALQSTRSSTPNLFNFLDTSNVLGIATDANWSHRFGSHVFNTATYQFSRLSTHDTPYFASRENASGNAGIQGNDQSPLNWGPPSLSFSSGIATLSDGLPASNHNQTSSVSDSALWIRGRHYLTFGADFRRQQFNYLAQQNPRGSFTFTGAATGSDFTDFLLGIPDTSAIAFGNADKYFRQSVYAAYFTDDWRISPELTVNVGARWEYSAPITELYGRLANLAIAPGFATATPVVANGLLKPDKRGFEPRIGIAWRPFSGSSTLIRAGYGIYYNTSVYQNIALQMSQQAPLAKSFNVSNSAATPLTLANGFNAPSIDTYAADPNFRIGYSQNWQASIQRDLPGSLQMTATYLGIKGTRGMQEFLPNTDPAGVVTCANCPRGFVYLSSNGNSTRDAGQFQLRRRLHNGLTTTLQYTFSKSIDDDSSLGGQVFSLTQTSSSSTGAALMPPTAAIQPNAMIAQNWLDLSAERSRSSFDQRHLLNAQIQYTIGMGLGGGTLLSGWRGSLFKDWTFATLIGAGSGLPETPILPTPANGTGITGTLRPNYTGAALYNAPSGLYLNPAAYAVPASGEWGNAGRNTINGPVQFTFNASMGRTFRMNDRLNLDLRIDSTNALNHVTYASWNTAVTSAQFGLPTAANNMRSLQTTLRLSF